MPDLIKHTVGYRLTRSVDNNSRGDYTVAVLALNFIHAIDKVVHSFSDCEAVRVETVRISPFKDAMYTVFDSENLVR